MVPLFKGFCSCDWSIAKGLRCLDVLFRCWSWESKLSLATESMGAHENKNPSTNSGHHPGYWRARGRSVGKWTNVVSTHTAEQSTTDQDVSLVSPSQAWLIRAHLPGKRPRKTRSNPLFCSAWIPVRLFSAVCCCRMLMGVLLRPPTATHQQFPSQPISTYPSIHRRVPYHSLLQQVKRYNTTLHSVTVPTQSPERVQSRAASERCRNRQAVTG